MAIYQIWCDDKLLHDLRYSDLAVASPKLQLGLNKVGGLTFTIYTSHPYIEYLEKMKSIVSVYRDDQLLFKGRVLETVRNFDTSVEVDCEGSLAYFCDSIQRPFEFKDGGPRQLLEYLINRHNAQVNSFQQFKLGVVTVTDPNNYIYRWDDSYHNTWECITSKLVETLGGYIILRYEDDGMYIDYRDTLDATSTQEIRFSENLLDTLQAVNGADTASMIIPVGAEINSGSEQTLRNRVTIASVNDGKDYLENNDAIREHGRICKMVDWPDITEPSNLLTAARKYMESAINMKVNLEVKAVDLNLTDAAIEAFDVGDNIHIESAPHGLDKTLLLQEIEIDMAEPQNTVIKLGDDSTTFTDIIRHNSNVANERINAMSGALEPLKKALTLDLDTNVLIFPCDAEGKPLTDLTGAITMTVKRGNWQTVTDYAADVGGLHDGITPDIDGQQVSFAVSTDTPIAAVNAYALTVAVGSDTVSKVVTVCGVRKGQTGDPGIDGVSTYFHVRYSANANGNPMSEEPADDTKYIGVVSTTLATAPASYTAYKWSRYVGENAYRVEIFSTYGNIFKNGLISTVLIARVYSGSEDITETINAANFRWSRSSDDAGEDEAWNTEHTGGMKQVLITGEDVYHRATFSCQILGLD